ncbi:MAG: hypothetical protein ACR2O4_03280, partial [Hyphomicrobiaceae bacterium]
QVAIRSSAGGSGTRSGSGLGVASVTAASSSVVGAGSVGLPVVTSDEVDELVELSWAKDGTLPDGPCIEVKATALPNNADMRRINDLWIAVIPGSS